MPEVSLDETEFPTGTAIRHIGYDLTKYPSPLGPNSLYGLLNEVLFDPILPVFLDNEALTTRQRRTIVGSRNSLNGASEDDGDIRVLRSDDTLKRLNNEARDYGRDEEDQTAEQQLRVEVAKILKSYGLELMENIGAQPTSVRGGRDPTLGDEGTIRVELTRPGLPVLSDERPFKIVEAPEVDTPQKKAAVPPFKLIPVKDIDDPRWQALAWPDDVSQVASSANMSEGILEVCYSEVFPGYRDRLKRLESRDLGLGKSFSQRYGIWLAVHSLLFHQDNDGNISASASSTELSDSNASGQSPEDDLAERRERCRIATIAAIFAMREITQKPSEASDD